MKPLTSVGAIACDKLEGVVKRQALHSMCALALLVGGCPRHSATRLTYVPAPPLPAAKAEPGTATRGMLVIEEPPPPAPPQQPPAAPAGPAPVEAAPHRRRPQTPVAEKPAETPPVPAPLLEPLGEVNLEPSLASQVATLQRALSMRIDQADALDLKPSDRHTFEDARGFLAQSLRALQEGDMDRSMRLAKKASLLLDAVEQQR